MKEFNLAKPALSHHRGIRSYVLRQGHLTQLQEKAIKELFPIFGVYYSSLQTLPLDDLFKRNGKKIIEIGFGMGAATVEIAEKFPDFDFLGIEVHGPGVGNILHLINEKSLSNIRVVRHDAVEVIDHMLANESIDGIHIFFPDPWHKKRHHKRRLIQTPFIEKLLRIMKKGAYIHLATDWEEYAEQMLGVLSQQDALKNKFKTYAPKPDYRPETKFETRGKLLGHGVWDVVFEKN